MRIAHVRDGLVVNVSVGELADTVAAEGETLLDAGPAGPGWTWDGTQLQPPPDPPSPPGPPRLITVFAFRMRLTNDEKTAIYVAAATIPQLRVWLDDLATASWVDLDLPQLRTALMSLEGTLLAHGRAVEVLDAPVQPFERV